MDCFGDFMRLYLLSLSSEKRFILSHMFNNLKGELKCVSLFYF